MKKLALAATGLALLLGATPLSAAQRRFAECRVAHPSYYFQSYGRRGHGKYRAGHFTRYHAPRNLRYNDRYRFDGRRRFDNRRRYSGPYRYNDGPYRYYNAPYRGPYRVRPYGFRRGFGPPVYRHRGHRPRIGIYLEF